MCICAIEYFTFSIMHIFLEDYSYVEMVENQSKEKIYRNMKCLSTLMIDGEQNFEQ